MVPTLTQIAAHGPYVIVSAKGYDATIVQNTSAEWSGRDSLAMLLGIQGADIIDRAGDRWISLHALKDLVHQSRRNQQQGKTKLKLANPSPYLQNLLELTGTLHLFDVYQTLEQALEAHKQSRT